MPHTENQYFLRDMQLLLKEAEEEFSRASCNCWLKTECSLLLKGREDQLSHPAADYRGEKSRDESFAQVSLLILKVSIPSTEFF